MSKLNKGDFVTVRVGRTKVCGGIYIRHKTVEGINNLMTIINVKYEASFFDKKEMDIIAGHWLDNVTKMSDEQAKKYNWILKEEE